jgi:prophage DNA circulation protein
MTWENRLREAAYTSPSGTRLTFQYEDVGRTVSVKGATFEFTDADGTFVQDLGRTGRRYPLRMFFSGPDCDLQATAFEDALNERGQGTLEHPVYGSVLVVPFGDISRRDDLVSAANQAVLEVTFFQTNGLIYPSPVADTAGAVADQVAAAEEAQAQWFGAAFVESTATVLADLRSRYNAALNTANDILRPIADTVTGTQRAFDQIQASINRGLDVLIGQPLTLAYQTIQLIKTPAHVSQQVGARLDAYSNLFQQYVGRPAENRTALYNRDLFASTAATAAAQAAFNTTYTRRPEAVLAAEQLLTRLDELAAWRDEQFAALGEVDDGSSWQATQDLLATVAGALVDQSFDLAAERVLVLTSDRSIIDVCFEVYGSVDDKLDVLMADNDLSGDEIIELPRGRRVVYYA